MPDYVNLTAENIDDHHLCCALGDKKHAAGVTRKKAWLRERLAEGLVFRKLDVRGKVFIEYMPAERAWRPISAPGWLTVHCLWVSGRFAGQGHGRALVDYALGDARRRGRSGIVIAASKRKRPYLSDPRFLRHLGFSVVDQHGEWRLFARSVEAQPAHAPRFTDAVRRPHAGAGFVGRMTDQCPFNQHWGARVVADLQAAGHPARLEHITTADAAQQVASPLGAWSLERGGQLACHHITTTSATGRLLAKLES